MSIFRTRHERWTNWNSWRPYYWCWKKKPTQHTKVSRNSRNHRRLWWQRSRSEFREDEFHRVGTRELPNPEWELYGTVEWSCCWTNRPTDREVGGLCWCWCLGFILLFVLGCQRSILFVSFHFVRFRILVNISNI